MLHVLFIKFQLGHCMMFISVMFQQTEKRPLSVVSHTRDRQKQKITLSITHFMDTNDLVLSSHLYQNPVSHKQ